MQKEEGCVIIQSCDKYQELWPNLFWAMNKYWDFSIPWTIYFCTETKDIVFPNEKYKQIKTGNMNHAKMFSKILSELKEYKYVFYMLEDFWPTDKMDKETFLELFKIFKDNDLDSLRVSSHMPEYYKLEKTNIFFKDKMIFKYSKDSEWKFSQQAGFWKRELLENCIAESSTSESEVGSSLPVEIATDINLRNKYPDAKIYHHHYVWYPIGGSYWRGKITLIGQQIEFERKVDELVKFMSN
jgi:hypothetical protein